MCNSSASYTTRLGRLKGHPKKLGSCPWEIIHRLRVKNMLFTKKGPPKKMRCGKPERNPPRSRCPRIFLVGRPKQYDCCCNLQEYLSVFLVGFLRIADLELQVELCFVLRLEARFKFKLKPLRLWESMGGMNRFFHLFKQICLSSAIGFKGLDVLMFYIYISRGLKATGWISPLAAHNSTASLVTALLCQINLVLGVANSRWDSHRIWELPPFYQPLYCSRASFTLILPETKQDKADRFVRGRGDKSFYQTAIVGPTDLSVPMVAARPPAESARHPWALPIGIGGV